MAATIPGGDAEFNAWLGNFVTYAGANLANLGIPACREGNHGTAWGGWWPRTRIGV